MGLPGADDPEQLDAFVEAYDGQGPTDADVADSADSSVLATASEAEGSP